MGLLPSSDTSPSPSQQRIKNVTNQESGAASLIWTGIPAPCNVLPPALEVRLSVLERPGCVCFFSDKTCPPHSLVPTPSPPPGSHSHTPADTRPLPGEAAAGPALKSPWSARTCPVWGPEQASQGREEGREGGPLSRSPPLTAGDFSSTKPSSGLHSAATKLPLARSGKGSASVHSRGPAARLAPGSLTPGPALPRFPHPRARLAPGSLTPGPAPLTGAPRAARPAAARALPGTGAAAGPEPPSRQAESPWGHASAGAASATASGRRRAPGRWGRRGRGVSAAHRGPPGPVSLPALAPRLPHPLRPGRAAPEHAPGGNLHGRGLGLGLHPAAACLYARRHAPPRPPPELRAVLAPADCLPRQPRPLHRPSPLCALLTVPGPSALPEALAPTPGLGAQLAGCWRCRSPLFCPQVSSGLLSSKA